jgi:uncharacterized protein (TIGR02118 family)
VIKFFGLIPRRPDISSEEFHDHYRHPHGTLGKEIPGFRGYVQSHQISTDLLGGDQTVFEAVAEVWFDNMSDAVRLGEDPHYLEHLQPDEPNFVDMDKLKWLYTTEEVVLSGPDPREATPLAHRLLQGMHLERPVTVKLLHFGAHERRLQDPTNFAGRLGAVRHVRCAPHAEIHADEAPAFAEVHELWWPTRWDFEHGVAGAEDELRALADGDRGSVTLLATAERFI